MSYGYPKLFNEPQWLPYKVPVEPPKKDDKDASVQKKR
jgi:hypothetical protein